MPDFLPGWRGDRGDGAGPGLCSCQRQCPVPSQPLLLRDAAFLAILLGHGLAPEQGLLHREGILPHLRGLLGLRDLSGLPGPYLHRDRGQRQAATSPTSAATSTGSCYAPVQGRASPCAGPSCLSICQQHRRVAPALVLSQLGSPKTAPSPPALQSHSPCSVALCCWHIPGCAQEGPQPTAGGGLWADSPASASVAWDLDGKRDREGNSQGGVLLPCPAVSSQGSEPGLVLLHQRSCSSHCACCHCQAGEAGVHGRGAGLDPQGTGAFL